MAEHLATSLFYRRGQRDLAALLGCEATEEAVLAARAREEPEGYARRLVQAANIGVMAVDTGFRGGENYTLREQRRFLPCAVHEVLRVESLVEELTPTVGSLGALEEALRASLADARSRGIVAFKSIAAYRGGLQVSPPDRSLAADGFAMLRKAAGRGEPVRLHHRPLLEHMLRIALEAAAAQELPVQFHTGFGDDDADLRQASPLHLRPLLQDPAYRGAPVVLLHCWPYVREAGYLAGIYSHVYVDLSLTIPFTAHGGAAAILAALEQAPASKLLLSTDAFSIPELFYLGALYARRSLSEALESLIRSGWIVSSEAEGIARTALHENAARLYGIGHD